VRVTVLAAAIVKSALIWDRTPCSLAEVYHISEEYAASIFRVYQKPSKRLLIVLVIIVNIVQGVSKRALHL
jgi:hypothetical protein